MRTLTTENLETLLPTDHGAVRVVTSGNGAVPWTLLRMVDGILPEYKLHMLNAPPGIPERDGVAYETTFVGSGMRKHQDLDYFPCRLSRVPVLFGRRLTVDVVLVHVSAPVGGKVSLGIGVDVMPAAMAAAKSSGGVVIAQVNPRMPYTYGDGEYPIEAFDGFVEVDEPLATLPGSPAGLTGGAASESAAVIGDLVASRVGFGATLQLGIGEIPDATLSGLADKRGLGIWTEMISDGVLALDRAGALDTDRPVVSSFVFGSEDLYRWVHRNPRVRILRTETTNSPAIIAANPGMTSINTALQVDLRDQANASRIGSRIYSGFGGQTDFTVGAVHAPGGQAIMALRSWHPKADVSTIVSNLDVPVTSFQHSIVVTEHGVAEVDGKTAKQQAANIINFAADPRARDELWEGAAEYGLT